MNQTVTQFVEWVKWLDRLIDPLPKPRPQPERKPMAIRVALGQRHLDQYRRILSELSDAEVQVLTSLRDRPDANALLISIRAARRDTITRIAPLLGLDVEQELNTSNVFKLPSRSVDD